jgi:hypothetical protein
MEISTVGTIKSTNIIKWVVYLLEIKLKSIGRENVLISSRVLLQNIPINFGYMQNLLTSLERGELELPHECYLVDPDKDGVWGIKWHAEFLPQSQEEFLGGNTQKRPYVFLKISEKSVEVAYNLEGLEEFLQFPELDSEDTLVST